MIVADNHFAYLQLQKGALSYLKADRIAWLAAYERSLDCDFNSLKPHLPPVSPGLRVLDVGSGLGGIDVLLDRHYGGIEVCLLDGIDDAPQMMLHRCTFNSMKVAGDFLSANGVRVWRHVGMPPVNVAPTNIIISLGSWCFHYPPSEYLGFVKRCCRRSTVLILDVRRDKPHWRAELRSSFDEVAIALMKPKFNRLVFRAR